MIKKVIKKIKGRPATDGAGVHLVRVLGHNTVKEFDPFLMLDSFDSTDPKDYIKGFPMHPHRGIETISYISRGMMKHRDHLGNEDTVSDGEVQWMTAGSGIMHEEKLPPVERMLGLQLWLNMSSENKMLAHPDYVALKASDIPAKHVDGGKVRVLVGTFEDVSGYKAQYTPIEYYAINLEPYASLGIHVDPNWTTFVYTLLGDIDIANERVLEKTAALTDGGDELVINALDKPVEFLVLSGKPLNEPIAWGGPIVMNTNEELDLAFNELDNGTFIKEEIRYE